MVFDIFKNRPELLHMTDGGFESGRVAGIMLLPENQPEQFEQRADDSEFIAREGL